MAKVAWCIVVGDEAWSLARIEDQDIRTSEVQAVEAGADPANLAAEIRTALVEFGHNREPVLMVLGSTRCLCTTLPVPSRRHGRNRLAMGYLLEAETPWAAEDMIFDYQLHGAHAVMVATERTWLSQLVDQLEDGGIHIDSIAPLAWLAMDEHLPTTRGLPNRYVLAWCDEDSAELWLIDSGKPLNWRHLPADASTAAASLRQLLLTEGDSVPVFSRDCTSPWQSDVSRLAQVAISPLAETDDDRGLFRTAMRGVVAVLDGRRSPSIELRRQSLSTSERLRPLRRNLQAVQGLLLVLFLAIGVSLWQKAHQYDTSRQVLGDMQRQLYSQLFPDQRVPVGVRATLESELARLRGMRGDSGELPGLVASMTILERLLASLPTDFRYRILEVRIDNGQLYLVGQVRDHGDADRIATALRKSGLDVSAPSTHQLQSQGVEFRLSAAYGVAQEESPLKRG